MRKIIYIFLTLIAIFVNSTVYAIEARIPATSIGQALQSARNKNNFLTLKSAKFDVEKKIYNITYATKDGGIDIVKISKVTGKEIK